MAFLTLRAISGRIYRFIAIFGIVASLAGFGSAPVRAFDLLVSTFTDVPDPAIAGGLLNLNLTVANSDTDLSPAATLTLPLPAGMNFVSVTPSPACTHAAAVVTCNLGPLQGTFAGGVATPVIVTVRPMVTNVTDWTAVVTPTDPNPDNNTLTQQTTVDPGADLTFQTFAAAPSPISSGAVATFTTVLNNLGPYAASGATITFTLPPGLSYNAGSHSGSGWNCSSVGLAVTCSTLATINSTALSSQLTWTASVTYGQIGTIQTQASVTSVTKDGNGSNNTALADLSINPGTDLGVTKTVSANPVLAGRAVTFGVQVRNFGGFDADNLTLTDPLPANFTFVSATGTGWTCGHAAGTVTCTRPTLAVGLAPLVSIVATAPTNAQITPPGGYSTSNSAMVATTTTETVTANNTGTVNFQVERLGPDLRMTLSRPTLPVTTGQSLVSTLTVRNVGSGPVGATSTFQASYEPSANETYQSFFGAGWSYVGLVAGRHVFAHAGPLAVNTDAPVLTITTLASAAGAITSTVCTGQTNVTAPAEGDLDASNDCRSQGNTGSGAQSADIQLTKSVSPGTLVVGGNSITYSFTITNAGPNDALNVQLTDVLPSGLYQAAYTAGGQTKPATTVVGTWINGGTNGTCSGTSTQVCNLGTLANGASATASITLTRPLGDGTHTNTATAYSLGTGDPTLANNSAQATVTINPVTDIAVTQKSFSPTNMAPGFDVLAGIETVYTIQVRNLGPSTANNVVLTDTFTTIPGDFTFISASATGASCAAYNVAAQSVACTWTSLAATEVQTMTVRIRPNYLATQHSISNTASATTTTTETTTANNAMSATLRVAPGQVDLLITETDLADPVGYDPAVTDNLIVYQIDVTNRGPSYATNVRFTDTWTGPGGKTITLLCDRPDAPSGAATTCFGAPAPICSTASNVATCTLGNMAASTSRQHFLIYRVNQTPLVTGDTFSKTAVVSANEPETLSANNTELETTTVRALADMELVSKAAAPATVSINEPFVWTIRARNNGPGLGVNTILTDNMPAGMELTATPTFVLSSGGGSVNCTGSAGSTSFTCSFGDIASGVIATVTAPARLTAYPAGGNSINPASVRSDSVDINLLNNANSGTVAVVRSSIACSVYRDVNDNGIREPSETGITGVQVRLTGRDQWNNPVSILSTTDGSGNCQFTNLAPSDATGYTLTEVAQPSGFFDGQDKAGSSGAVIVGSKATDAISGVVLAANTALTGYTFGELQSASIAGRVWHDRNNNGIIDGSETERLSGVTITLTGTDDQNASVNRSTATLGTGQYAFINLRPGTYTLTETQPGSPWLEGRAAVGTGVTGALGAADNGLASVAFGNVISGIQLQGGNAGVEYNFGELKPGSLAGVVWYDIDNSGAQNGTEPGIAGVTVALTGTDYRGVTVSVPAATTSSTGAYSFANLKPGTYAIVETQPATYSDGLEQLGLIGGTATGTTGADQFTAIALPSEGAGTGYNFGERGRGIAGTVYNDLNDSGTQQVGTEMGIPTVSIRLTGCAVDLTTTTDNSGNYSFTGLPDCPGGYTLTQTQPAGYSDGKDTAGSVGGNATAVNDQISGIVLGATTYATGYNFGEHGIVATDIGCTVPALSARNVREPFNCTFTVSHVSGGGSPNTRLADTLPAGLELTGVPTVSNGGTCTGAATQTTFACTIGFLAPAQNVTVTAPVRVITYPTTPTAGTLTNGATITTDGNDTATANNACQAVLTVQQATLAGTVFADPNNDGVKQPTEQGIPNTTLRLTGTDLYNNAVDVTVQTIADGTYRFGGLSPSNPAGYTLTETQPTGYADGRDTVGTANGTLTNDVVSAIVLNANVNATGYNFGEISQGLAGSVYVDSNNNGVRDIGEVGIPNATLTVTGTDIDNIPVNAVATTDADGNYLFGGLRPSNATGYTLVETQPTGWADGLDKLGTASGTLANDRVTRLVLPAGVISSGYDFGERGASVCGFVYNDLDDNGLKGRTETGIPGARVTLTGTDINGRPVTQAVDTAGLVASATEPGRYCFTDLPVPGVGGYTITETQPADTTDGRDTAGTLGGTAGNDVISGVTFTQPGITGDNYNFGERSTVGAALSGFVWFDANHDRAREPTGRGGWTVELVRGTIGGTTTTIATTITAADGSYRFDGLPPGSGYTVLFRSPQGGYVYGFIQNITLTANTELTEQNQPIDPSGVVYDALTRAAVPGAVVRITGPAGFDPALHLVGGPGNVAQTTDATGEYKYLLLPGAPAGVYGLGVTVPTGYVQRISTAIPPCTTTLTVGPSAFPALVQSRDTAPASAIPLHNPAACPSSIGGLPAGAGTTQYYLALALSAISAAVINNHIPIEAIPTTGSLVFTKSALKSEVSRGELVPYTITIRNNIDLVQTDVSIVDQFPPGFQYRAGSAQIDGVRREPTQNARQLSWGPLTVGRNQTLTIKLLLVVGSGVGAGEFVNQAWAVNTFTGGIISNVAKATVRKRLMNDF